MEVSRYVSGASLWTPVRVPRPLGTAQLAPVIYWTVEATNPRCIVQLGVSPCSAYLLACEAVKRLKIGTRCIGVDPRAASSISGRESNGEAPEWAGHAAAYGGFSTLLHAAPEDWLANFGDGSIDLLLLADQEQVARLDHELDGWTRKLSDWGVVVLPGTRLERAGAEAGRLFQKLSARRPSFEFTHGGGVGLVAMGAHPPAGLRQLLEADARPALRDEIRSVYDRLGRSLFDALAGEADGPGVEGLEGSRSLRRTLAELREENAYLDERRRGLNEENILLRRENPFLLYNFNCYRHNHDVLRYELDQIKRSPIWPLLAFARRVRETCWPESRFHGRCLVLAERFVRTTLTVGPLEAGRRASRRVVRKLRGTVRRPESREAPPYRSLDPGSATDRFEDLPWMYTGERDLDGARLRPTFKILLIGHTACRTGAPLCLLRIAQELSRLPDVECWAFVRSRGELTDEFARCVPTLDLLQLGHAGLAWEDAPRLIASRFRAFARNGMAICNTSSVGEYHEPLSDAGVPVLSWIHELPTFMELHAGGAAVERIVKSSRHVLVPADVVRDSLTRRFGADPSRVVTINNGIEPKSVGLDRDAMRARFRLEFGLPDDALIVVGCGTIDLRKGADLFVQTARSFLNEPETAESAGRTWFFWFGFPSDEGLCDWLNHDLEAAGLSDRVRFVGTRQDMTPYFLGADVFTLTSREDPCPFANLEAMECALPVVAFEGSGGAPDVLGGAGVVVPYLDVHAMALAVGRLLAAPQRCIEMGRVGRSFIHRDFTWERHLEGLLRLLRVRFDYRPSRDLKVSVVVPSHRHAPYLEERLRSVFDQTVRPHEIIFLDDASCDGSVEIAKRLAPSSPAPMRIVVNERNSGGTFKQWLKGIELATGDLVWIAESDDSCRPEFLERLLPEFHDRDVALAYCQSALIGPHGEVLAENFLGHTDDLSPERWRAAFVQDADAEVESALGMKNTIPNASAVVFRRPDRLDFADESAEMRFAGDWLFYTMLIKGRKIAYAPEVLNYYRRHEQTVSHQAVRHETHAEETVRVKARIFESYPISPNAIARSLVQTVREYDLLTERYGLNRPPISSYERTEAGLNRIRKVLESRARIVGRKVLVVADGSDLGSTLEMTRDLARDQLVYLCFATPFNDAEEVDGSLGGRAVLIEGALSAGPSAPGEPLDRRRLGTLRELVRILGVEAIHSRAPVADRWGRELNAELNLPWLVHADQGREDEACEEDAAGGSSPAPVTVPGGSHGAEEIRRGLERHPVAAAARWIRIDTGHDADRTAAVCGQTRRQAHDDLRSR